jgi:hypothetical protein
MKNNDIEKEMTRLAFRLAESIITRNIIEYKGHVHKNIPYVQNIDKVVLSEVPKTWGRDAALHDLELFNDILCNVIEKRLDWYYAEGFTEELEDSYRFFSLEEIQQKHEELYGNDQYGQD